MGATNPTRIPERNARPRISGVFRRALAAVDSQESADDSPIAVLDSLGEKLSDWRKRCQRELRRQLAKVGNDHPIKCKIGLFGPMGMHRAEVSHTRALAWLLDPRSEHGFGSDLFSALLKRAHVQAGGPEFDVSLVEAERFFRGGKKDQGRTDIWIEGEWREETGPKRGLVVIEAKIDSDEGGGQLDRYSKEVGRYPAASSRKLKLLLTPRQDEPVKVRNGWVPLSFHDLSTAFLSRLGGLKGLPGYDFLRIYLAGVLSDILGIATGDTIGPADPYDRLQILKGVPVLTPKQEKPMEYVSRSLGFYLKHWDEMQYLHEERKDERVRDVAARASEQAENLLQKCSKCIEKHFQKVGAAAVKTKSQSRTIRRDWTIDVGLRRKGTSRSGSFRWMAGALISVDENQQPCVWLYLWGKGQGKSAKKIGQEIEELTRKMLNWSRTDDWYLDVAPFAKIPLLVQRDYTVDEAEVLRRVAAELKRLDKRKMERFLHV